MKCKYISKQIKIKLKKSTISRLCDFCFDFSVDCRKYEISDRICANYVIVWHVSE